MNSILAFVLASVAAHPAEPAVPSDAASHQIAVIGERLATWRGKVKSRDGELQCDIKTSTGDEAIDKIGCDALVSCTMDIKPQLDATAALDLPRKKRNQRMTALMEGQGPCILQRREAAIDALAQKRADSL